MEDILLKSTIDNNSVVIAGVLNICISDKSSSVDFSNQLISHYFRPLITIPTRMHNNSAIVLDQIWTNIPCLSFSGVIDHFPVFSILSNVNCTNNTLINIKFRDFSGKNHELFNNELSMVNWIELLGDMDCPDELSICFLDKLNEIYEKRFPIKTKRIGIKEL